MTITIALPALLVEILSPPNLETDLQIKRGAYARAGVPEYWIARPATRMYLYAAGPTRCSAIMFKRS
jgi:Uma2 family endonuclease